MSMHQTQLEPMFFQAIFVSITFTSYRRQSQVVLCISIVVSTIVMFAGLYL
jgi:hypothetical protein